MVLETEFATAERMGRMEVMSQNELFSENELFLEITNSISQMFVVLNAHRQIVYANNKFTDALGFTNVDAYIGKRPGESLNCVHASQSDGGCGTTEFCKTCGAVNAILESQEGIKSTKECRIALQNSEALDLEVTATPFKIREQVFSIFVVTDISNEKRRQTLERVFFHDVLNSAGGISGLSSIIGEVLDPEELTEIAGMINRSADDLVNEIQLQRELSVAERGEMVLKYSKINSLDLLKQLANLYLKHEVTKGKEIVIADTSMEFVLETDPVLLKRILGNMTKNALEASLPGGKVTISCKMENAEVVFAVHNGSYIERELQLQLFKRSFSTKGLGRGIGTYSMKLFGEKYLKGQVDFTSTREGGTTFFIKLNEV